MNPLAYSLKQQAKALAACLGALAGSLANAGSVQEVVVAVIAAAGTYYATFALPNSDA